MKGRLQLPAAAFLLPMARPPKNNADYFPHDAGMRNHRKLKALRNKFGAAGYGIWCMLLEHLTGADGNEFDEHNDELELLAGDFGVSATEIRDVLDFCYRIELLFNKNGFAFSESLNERLAPVYQKRGTAKELSKKQRRMNGKFCNNNADTTVVSATEMPQSKVKESKEEKSKVKLPAVAVPFVGEVLKVWNEWEQFKKEKRQTLTPSSIKKQIKFLGGRGDPEIIAIINQSIMNGYTGLFELKQQTNGHRTKTSSRTTGPDAIIEPGKDFGIEKGF